MSFCFFFSFVHYCELCVSLAILLSIMFLLTYKKKKPNFNLKNDITKGKEGLLPKDNIELQCSFIILVMCMY